MGRNTWMSLPQRVRPLPGRLNVVVSSTLQAGNSSLPAGVEVVSSLDAALDLIESAYTTKVDQVFVIGGAALYASALDSSRVGTIYLTRIGREFECDTHMPEIDTKRFRLVSLSRTHAYQDIPFDHLVYEAVKDGDGDRTNGYSCNGDADADAGAATNGVVGEGASSRGPKPASNGGEGMGHEEYQYLRLINDIIRHGIPQSDRTGVGTLAKFGCQMRFSLREAFPLLTTKRVFWKGVVEELLWFVRGDTNGNRLADKGVKIWQANGSRGFLDSRGLNSHEEHDLGPIYGFQWRHFGADYKDMHTDYTGEGVDQLAEVVRQIKADPTDRRIILTAWNPAALSRMALPPCHMMAQFLVDTSTSPHELTCIMFQRSADMGLGVPFNIASYALLTRMMAQVCGIAAGELVHVLGNAHVYSSHIGPLQEQLARVPRPFPILKVNPAVKTIDDFVSGDFELIGYHPHEKIAMQLAV
mmetsp:Transcript_43206/g.122379  ORF Transcript_43206/g.122379 Transcript_43206/m.122379 type:complete len:471 (-) Transcript_43206:523-1935(-)